MSSGRHADSLAHPSDEDGLTLPSMLADEQGSQFALLDLLRARLNRVLDLRAIAAADFDYRFSEYLTALERIVDSGVVDQAAFELQEVLSLICSTRPDDPTWDPGDVGIGGHMQRAFSCAVLLRMNDLIDFQDVKSLRLAPLIESCIALGDAYCDALSRYVIWRLRFTRRASDPDGDELFLSSLAFLILACEGQMSGRTSHRFPEPLFGELFDWVIATGDRRHKSRREHRDLRGDGLRLNWACFDLWGDIWRKLAKTAFIDRNSRLPASLQETARLLGETLLEDYLNGALSAPRTAL